MSDSVGPNGSDNTTIRSLTCFLTPTGGTAKVAILHPRANRWSKKRIIVYSPNSPGLSRDRYLEGVWLVVLPTSQGCLIVLLRASKKSRKRKKKSY